MLYAAAAVERAMKVQEVICRVLAGTLTWLQGADILGIHTRSLRRWRARYERDGVLGLHDGRRCCRTPKRAGIWTDDDDHDVGLARGALRVTSAARRR